VAMGTVKGVHPQSWWVAGSGYSPSWPIIARPPLGGKPGPYQFRTRNVWKTPARDVNGREEMSCANQAGSEAARDWAYAVRKTKLGTFQIRRFTLRALGKIFPFVPLENADGQ
jgi:hypothetical protein